MGTLLLSPMPNATCVPVDGRQRELAGHGLVVVLPPFSQSVTAVGQNAPCGAASNPRVGRRPAWEKGAAILTRKKSPPQYGHHRATGRARIIIDGEHEPGRFNTLGEHLVAEKINGLERGAAHLLTHIELLGPRVRDWAEAMLTARCNASLTSRTRRASSAGATL